MELRAIFASLAVSILLLTSSGAEAKFVGDHIYLVPVGDIDEKLLQHIKETIPGSFPFTVKVEILPKEKLIEQSHDASRMQYDAGAILNDFTDRTTIDARIDRFLLITDADLFVPKMNYVFGLSYPHKGASIMSIVRLRNEFYGKPRDDKALMSRAAKAAVQELGHSWSIRHCTTRKCVMYYSDNLDDMDRSPLKFCVSCRHDLRKR
jgi:archaemetzincin